MITGWGLPAWISKPAEAMGGGLGPVGEQYQARLDSLAAVLREEYEGLNVVGHAVERPVSTRVLAGICENPRRACLGASRAALGRALVGNAFDVVEPHHSDRDCSAKTSEAVFQGRKRPVMRQAFFF